MHELSIYLLTHVGGKIVGLRFARCKRVLQVSPTREMIANVTTPLSPAALGLLAQMVRLAMGSNPT